MDKKKVIIHYNNLSAEVLEALREKYPDGHMHHVFKVTKPNNDFFYAVTVDTEDTSYLIKVDVKIDNITEDKLDDAIFSNIDSVKPTGKMGEEEEAAEEDDDENAKGKNDDKDDDIF
jgi:hypothetical protein